MNSKVLPLKVHIATLVVGMLLVVSTSLMWVSDRTLTSQTLEAGEELFSRIADSTSDALELELKPAQIAVKILANSPLADANSLNARQRHLDALLAAIRSRGSFASAYVGTKNGSYLQVRELNEDFVRKIFDAPHDANYVARSISRDNPNSIDAVRYFYSADKSLVEARAVTNDDFDPRTRDWYLAANRAPDADAVISAPYKFATTGDIGISIAARHPDGFAVVGINITLGALSKLLAEYQKLKGMDLVLFDREGSIVAHPDPEIKPMLDARGNFDLVKLQDLSNPKMRAVWHQFQNQAAIASAENPKLKPGLGSAVRSNSMSTVDIDNREYFIRTDQVFDSGGTAFFLGALTPVDELIAPVKRARNNALMMTGSALLLVMLIAIQMANSISKPISALTREASEISRFHFETGTRQPTMVQEVQDLAVAVDSMRHTIRRFLEISTALGAEGNFAKLLDRILVETLDAAGATGGAVLLLSPDSTAFNGGAVSVPNSPDIKFSDIPKHLLKISGASVVSDCIEEKVTKTHRLVRDGTGSVDSILKLLMVDSCDTAVLPLIDRTGFVMGVLIVFWTDSADGKASTTDDERLKFVKALSGTASVALANQQLISQQKQLMQSFIELIAGAIDAKSPYTGGHCQRVPELTKMLAHAAEKKTEGPFADFRLNDDQWEALHIAAWLHDCGKVTTPEFVVDKATKLESVYDRIHEVRMRIELLKAQAEIDALRESVVVSGKGEDPSYLFDALRERWRELDDDWAFLAECNVGGEFMAPSKIERLKTISQYQWRRTLDNRLGVSAEEINRMMRTPAPTLPVMEPLLADRDEHVIERSESERLHPDTAPGNPWGFSLDMPTHLYNRGELYNLSISRGTLTAEERYKINDHIVQTIKMLEALPFPQHLKQVPEIAGGHHEKMDGKGYPKRLKRADMSLPARMMAIADIFEALTAADRPYKKGKLLSEAVKILAFMVKDQHIDADLFELFLSSGIYLDYAQRFMIPAQIDDVNVSDVLQSIKPSSHIGAYAT